MNKRFGLAVFLLAFSVSLFASDWPQWRGPDRDGISNEIGLLKEWPKDGPKLLWQMKDIGSGYSTPAAVGDRLYLLSNTGIDNEFVQALDIKDGKQIWVKHIGKVGKNEGPQYPAARSTPTVDGDFLYTLGSDGDLACLELSSGTAKWQKNLRSEFGGSPGSWAYAESVLIDGDTLVCTPGGADATIVALNKKNGELIWKCAVPGGDLAAYASIIIFEVGGIKQYVQFLSKGVVGVDAKTGTFLWKYEKTARGSPANIPTPVAFQDLIYTSGYRAGGAVVKLKADKDAVRAEEVYFSRDVPVAIGGAVRIGDYLYGTNPKGLVCVEFKTGTVKWQDECVGPGSLCFADGMLYVHGENNDEVALVEASSESYREKGRVNPPDQPRRGSSKAWAYPIVANGRLYIRDLTSLWCYEVKANQ